MRNSSNRLVRAAALAALAAVFLGTARAGAIEDGEAAFAAGDYPAAVRAFETAASAQGPSAGLYFNLGMSQMRSGDRPAAAVSFRRALMLDPRMVDARMALSDVERSQGVSTAKPTWQDWVAEKLPLQALLIAGIAVAWTGAFFVVAEIFRGGRRFWRVVGALALVILGGAVFSAGYLADPRVAWAASAVVLPSDGTSLLSAPADQSNVVTRLPGAAMVRVLQRSGEWAFCQAASGERGWTAAKSLQSLRPAA